MKFTALTSKVSRQLLKAKKHSPTLMFVAGTVGIIGTVILACRATMKLEEIVEDTNEDLMLVDQFKDEIKSTEKERSYDKALIKLRAAGRIVKLYAPSAILGGLSVAALTGSHVVLRRRNLGLTAAYAAVDQAFRKYRERVATEFGPDKEHELRHDITDRVLIEETDKGPVKKTVKVPGAPSMYARFFDEYNKNWEKNPNSNQFFVQCMQNYANDLLNSRGHLFLNEVYDMLGLPRSPEGQIVGWVKDNPKGDGFVDFGVFEGDFHMAMRFVMGEERSVLLDFNVDGVVYDMI